MCSKSGKCRAMWPRGSQLASERWQEHRRAREPTQEGQQSLAPPGTLQLSSEAGAGAHLPTTGGRGGWWPSVRSCATVEGNGIKEELGFQGLVPVAQVTVFFSSEHFQGMGAYQVRKPPLRPWPWPQLFHHKRLGWFSGCPAGDTPYGCPVGP